MSISKFSEIPSHEPSYEDPHGFMQSLRLFVGKRLSLDRDDLLIIGQVFNRLSAMKDPLTYAVHEFAKPLVSDRSFTALDKLARAHDAKQAMPYHNACQSAKEMILGLLFTCMSPKYDRRDCDAIALALAGHYYDIQHEASLKIGSKSCAIHACNVIRKEGILQDVDSLVVQNTMMLMWSCLWEILPSTRLHHIPLHGREGETPLIMRNAHDAISMSFCGVSYENFIHDALRIENQTGREFGEGIAMRRIESLNLYPLGLAEDTAFDIFFNRMIYHCVDKKRLIAVTQEA